MKRLLRTCLPLALGLLSTSLEARAQSFTAVGVARASEGLIKIYDPKVRDVSLVVPAPEGTPTPCREDNQSNNSDWEAFYCRLDRTILISQQALSQIEKRYGLEAVATLVAHEFAHGRQHALTGFSSDLVWTSVFDELQADCIAGVYMRRATPIALSEKQIERSKDFLRNIGNYSILERDWHGTPGMRGAVFQFGYEKGSLNSCLASGERNWRNILVNSTAVIDKAIDKGSDTVEKVRERASPVIDKLIERGSELLNDS